jgi:O-antigen ligase
LQSRETQEIHNLALYSVVQYGLPATLLFFAFFFRLFRRAIRAAREGAQPGRSVLVAIGASLSANVLLYGSTTMLIDSVQTTTWLLFWAGIASYLIAYAAARDRESSPALTARPMLFPENGKLA